MKIVGPIPDRWLAIGLLGYTLGIAGWLLLSGVRVTLEDGFYYFKIAQQLAQGSGWVYWLYWSFSSESFTWLAGIFKCMII